ncbi:MAG TPA: hypothetical protein GX706_03810 [Candidatus Moranbacteria bacterium]|nr:hypothetical protein [Candidatus Moranbacteria bacterium]
MNRVGNLVTILSTSFAAVLVSVQLVALALIFFGAIKISGFKVALLLMLSLVLWQFAKRLPVFPGELFWRWSAIITSLVVIAFAIFGEDGIRAMGQYKYSGSTQSVVETIAKSNQMSKRVMLSDKPFLVDLKGKQRNGIVSKGETLFCPNPPEKSKDGGEQLIRCMRKDSDGNFVTGGWGYVPVLATESETLQSFSTNNQKTTADYERLQAENEGLRSQISNLQNQQRGEIAGLQGQIKSLQSQLADRDAKIGQLNATTAQAQQAQRAAEQNARQFEKNWRGAESREKRWEMHARRCWGN